MKTALEELRGSIPPFTSWQTGALEGIFERYREILERLCHVERYAVACRDLLQNTELIAWLIADLKACNSAVSYDRAAMELSWDIETLIGMLND